MQPIHIAKIALTGAMIGLGALASAAQVNAEPVAPLPVVPGEPAPAGQMVQDVAGGDSMAAPAPPPAGAPFVPEIQNPGYGKGGSSSGPLGSILDIYREAKDPYGANMPGGVPEYTPPPPGAGPPPPLPPGYQSFTAPGSSTPASAPPAGGDRYAGGPPLPEGYYPINAGPPPPEYYDGAPAAPGAAPGAYRPVVSEPPPPLMPTP
jgi:hypothetical protein